MHDEYGQVGSRSGPHVPSRGGSLPRHRTRWHARGCCLSPRTLAACTLPRPQGMCQSGERHCCCSCSASTSNPHCRRWYHHLKAKGYGARVLSPETRQRPTTHLCPSGCSTGTPAPPTQGGRCCLTLRSPVLEQLMAALPCERGRTRFVLFVRGAWVCLTVPSSCSESG